jgi:hypothetical protein
MLAALKKFGLIVDEGSAAGRRARLSGDALRIIQDEREDSTDRQQLLKEAALKPTIHRELWDEFDGSLPSDANLRFKLLNEHSFTPNAVNDFIRQFRDTLAFAGLSSGDSMRASSEPTQILQPSGGIPSGEQFGTPMVATATQTTPETMGREIQIPISPTEWAALRAPFPLTEAKWKQMIAVLNAMKPALVPEATPASDETTGGDA